MGVPQSAEDPLVAQAFDAAKHKDLARAVEQLSPDEAAFFLHKLEMALRKRKIQITGYLVAMVAWLIAMTLALVYAGMHDGFIGWVFLLPFALVGAILYGFGRWAERIGRTPVPRASVITSEPSSPSDDDAGRGRP
ncbi:MAG TPA: hypothetical protein VHN14_06205 [Kofleriaceae bacterium]|nr:hypothetical protein [Kofleriaceae bacterium]